MSASPPVVLHTERLVLSMLSVDDAPRVARYYRDNGAFHAATNPPMPAGVITEAHWRERIPLIHQDYVEDRSARFFFSLRADPDGPLVGQCSLTQIQRGPSQWCNLGYSLDERHQRLGIMSEALPAVIAFAFERLGLHRLQASYLPTNERSGRVLRRLGFRIEGYAKDYLFIGGAWRDHVLTSLTNHAIEQP